jgi:hypothetical protein
MHWGIPSQRREWKIRVITAGERKPMQDIATTLTTARARYDVGTPPLNQRMIEGTAYLSTPPVRSWSAIAFVIWPERLIFKVKRLDWRTRLGWLTEGAKART